jgi:adenylate cyclase
VTLVNAGHVPPLWYHAASQTVEEAVEREKIGFPLGVAAVRYGAVTIGLQPGDCILLVTDGVTEAQNSKNQLFGLEQVAAVMSSGSTTAPDIGLRLIETVKAYFQSHNDDLTVVCFGRDADKPLLHT